MFLDLRLNFCDPKSIILMLNFFQLRFSSVQYLTLQCWRTALEATNWTATILIAHKQFICNFISQQTIETFHCTSSYSVNEDWMILLSNIQSVLMWCLSECTLTVSFGLVFLRHFVWQHWTDQYSSSICLTSDVIHVVKGRDQFYVDKKKKKGYTLRLTQFINTFSESLIEHLHHTSISYDFSIKGKVVPVLIS